MLCQVQHPARTPRCDGPFWGNGSHLTSHNVCACVCVSVHLCVCVCVYVCLCVHLCVCMCGLSPWFCAWRKCKGSCTRIHAVHSAFFVCAANKEHRARQLTLAALKPMITARTKIKTNRSRCAFFFVCLFCFVCFVLACLLCCVTADMSLCWVFGCLCRRSKLNLMS